jgi:nucleoid-associated protein YgaU
MSRDYRIGLIAGSVLAGVALVWVATRPNLGLRLPLAPDSNQSAPRTSLAGGHRAKAQETKMDKGPVRSSVRLPPASVLQDPPPVTSEPAASARTEPNQPFRTHVVRPGETLSTIAQQYYGSANSWHKIVAANQNTIKDGNKIAAGMKLVIPE